MLIENKTAVILRIRGVPLEPDESMEYREKGAADKLEIRSEIGSCTITTEYDKRIIRNDGKLVAKEGGNNDWRGMRNIIVTTLES